MYAFCLVHMVCDSRVWRATFFPPPPPVPFSAATSLQPREGDRVRQERLQATLRGLHEQPVQRRRDRLRRPAAVYDHELQEPPGRAEAGDRQGRGGALRQGRRAGAGKRVHLRGDQSGRILVDEVSCRAPREIGRRCVVFVTSPFRFLRKKKHVCFALEPEREKYLFCARVSASFGWPRRLQSLATINLLRRRVGRVCRIPSAVVEAAAAVFVALTSCACSAPFWSLPPVSAVVAAAADQRQVSVLQEGKAAPGGSSGGSGRL